jgi:uncharacterized protein YjiS (DUF1127 family)
MPRNAVLAALSIKDRARASGRRRSDHWRAWTVALVSIVLRWLERSRSRRALAALNDHALRDIGITRAEAGFESTKPFYEP